MKPGVNSTIKEQSDPRHQLKSAKAGLSREFRSGWAFSCWVPSPAASLPLFSRVVQVWVVLVFRGLGCSGPGELGGSGPVGVW